ncbi:AbiU2 domain-containing protein [Sulfitobacter sp. D7]|uniref:AbiU2 domain-containing protein n=1 Tax=Sulfitobacter sp. D7 TaxID=1968541 RepID=UPI0013C4D7BD|nr:hypothetical protein [Sulfitobacter sp. D7]
MTTRTHDEIAAEYAKDFGEADGFLVHRLTNSVSQLILQWRMFLFFYCGPLERIEVLNEASGLTARTFQNLLRDNTILNVRRLTDREKSRGEINVSLAHLLRISREKGIACLDVPYEELLSSCETTRRYADKHIAHSDFDHAAGRKISSTNRGETTKAIKEISSFVQLFHKKITDVSYELVPRTSVSDEQQFLKRLYLGNQSSVEQTSEKIRQAKAGDWDSAFQSIYPDWLSDDHFRDNPF